jgi:hypothetical protein
MTDSSGQKALVGAFADACGGHRSAQHARFGFYFNCEGVLGAVLAVQGTSKYSKK